MTAAVHMKTLRATALLFALLCAPPAAHAHKVLYIADGDSLTLQAGRKRIKLRLAGIDAPEIKQAFGQKSRQSLYQLCWGKDARYDAKAIDHFGRTVATLRCDGIDAGRAQVERGMAWAAARAGSHLKMLETAARNAKAGLWSDPHPVAPWRFRHGTDTDAACRTGPRGGRYQWINGRKIYGC
ncbi:thermonuclease family protein [Collimonas sp.]|jgi:micrococcal nuclease|uniref:thermonuclease family protein n=1 Tax=Collimonas sp. TaxID=1963772 RepID=UPI002D0B9D35|nr:thermonuclease family protein [Collimonas sp.]HWX01575.1 thermonuclease family protein [Collimonas sp.]